MITSEQILGGLNTIHIGRKIYSFDTIDSTNTYARSLKGLEVSHGTLVIAEEQSAGRGRLNRQWVGETGKCPIFLTRKFHFFRLPDHSRYRMQSNQLLAFPPPVNGRMTY